MPSIHYNNSIAVIAFFCAVCITLLTLWFIVELRSERKALADLAFAYDDASQKSIYESSVRALLRDTEHERKELKALTGGHDPVEIIRTLEDIAKRTGVTLSVEAVSPGGVSSDDPSLSSFLVIVRVTAEFDKMHHFISLVSSLPFPSYVEKAKIEKIEKVWQANIILRVFTHESI